MARPVFILSSGRSGTFQIVSLLQLNPDLEVHHEYKFGQTLMSGVKSYMIREFTPELKASIRSNHVVAVDSSSKKYWVDVSNALPWTLPTLVEQFPKAIFVLLVRNGRRVVSSFFHKFREEMYQPEVIESLMNWKNSRGQRGGPEDPRLWRPLPRDWRETGLSMSDRFELLCWYWAELNEYTRKNLEKSSAEFHVFRFEDILRDRDALGHFLALFEIEPSEQHLEALSRPVNVAVPKTFPLEPDQERSFWSLCGPTMESFGYSQKDDYVVDY